MVDAVTLSGLQQKTLIVAPGFKTKYEAEGDEYFWGASGWSQGDLALNGRDETKVSSFDIVDNLLATLADRTNVPALETVAVIGHSAGGQFVNRYASAADLPEDCDIDFRFIVLNPSSHMYPDERRLSEGKVVGADELSQKFSDYNQHRYGTDDLNTAMRRVGMERIREQLLTRKCYNFAGSKDTKSDRVDTAFGAMVQGQHRFARFCS